MAPLAHSPGHPQPLWGLSFSRLVVLALVLSLTFLALPLTPLEFPLDQVVTTKRMPAKAVRLRHLRTDLGSSPGVLTPSHNFQMAGLYAVPIASTSVVDVVNSHPRRYRPNLPLVGLPVSPPPGTQYSVATMVVRPLPTKTAGVFISYGRRVVLPVLSRDHTAEFTILTRYPDSGLRCPNRHPANH